MKKSFTLLFVLIFVTMTNLCAYANWETDFNAFKVGDPKNKIATFKFLGEKRTMSVSEIKDMLRKLGYGTYFESDEAGAGYTSNVEKAFRAYIEPYTEKLRAAEKELSKSQGS